ncbi:hypothetical protein Scep_021682 [Stephania cephalantha]|uniref:Uncharacterized protein n=1 Tax=Stephania cephalantha TaxID=152367 RepID=A0AAP0F8Z5_9MAGN
MSSPILFRGSLFRNEPIFSSNVNLLLRICAVDFSSSSWYSLFQIFTLTLTSLEITMNSSLIMNQFSLACMPSSPKVVPI